MPICTGKDSDGVLHICIEEMFNPDAILGPHLTIPCITDSDGKRWPIALRFCDCTPTREEACRAMDLLSTLFMP